MWEKSGQASQDGHYKTAAKQCEDKIWEQTTSKKAINTNCFKHYVFELALFDS